MTNSATSTDRTDAPQTFQAWHFFLLLGMAGATVAVMVSRQTHPAALLLLSAAVVCTGLVGLAVHKTVSAFFGRGRETMPPAGRSREELLREKAMALRSIKELEFDRAMGKINDADYEAISKRLRARALTLMEAVQAEPAPAPTGKPHATSDARRPGATRCPQCGTENDTDARFCKHCGQALSAQTSGAGN